MPPSIHSVFVGRPQPITDEHGTWISSIIRSRVEGPIELTRRGLQGDRVHQPYHGGRDGAVCVHLCDHYDFWNQHYGLSLQPGSVGENFTLSGATEDNICAGDIVRVGTALVQVSGPRIPCANQARRIGRPDWVRLTIQENRTGFYLRVVEPGVVQAGDLWELQELQERQNKDASIVAINRCMYLDFNRDFAERMTQAPGLGDWWKQRFVEKLGEHSPHRTD